jgi:ATP phosphoribosyltransferase regulatory subunit
LNKQNDIEQPERELIFAPYVDDVVLCEIIRDLRAQNRAVVQQLPNQIGGAIELNCTAVLVKNSEGVWIVESL